MNEQKGRGQKETWKGSKMKTGTVCKGVKKIGRGKKLFQRGGANQINKKAGTEKNKQHNRDIL